MGLALVEEQGGVAEGAVVTEGATELAEAGVLAVLVAQQGLLVAALVAAVATGVERGWLAGMVLGRHVLLQLVLPLANKGTHLAHQRLALVLQLVAAQLIGPVAAIGALVTLVSGERGGGRGRGSEIIVINLLSQLTVPKDLLSQGLYSVLYIHHLMWSSLPLPYEIGTHFTSEETRAQKLTTCLKLQSKVQRWSSFMACVLAPTLYCSLKGWYHKSATRWGLLKSGHAYSPTGQVFLTHSHSPMKE